MTGIFDVLTDFNTYFLNKELTIPAIQLVYFLGLINILMVLRYYRVSYLISLVFSLYWLVVLNQDKFGPLSSDIATGGWVMLGSGLVLLIISLFCFLAQSNN